MEREEGEPYKKSCSTSKSPEPDVNERTVSFAAEFD